MQSVLRISQIFTTTVERIGLVTEFYRISEFARLAGLTVRTLQYYDRIDLLKPASTTEGGHRVYQRADLLRLQQILTLKWMGFKLDQIKELLASPRFDLRTALAMQKAAIDSQIANLQQASTALETALNMDTLQAGEIDQATIQTLIRAVAAPANDWLQNAYTDEAWAGVVTRQMQYTQADFEQFAEDWRILIEQFAEVGHLPPDSEPVQKLAATMHKYVTLFTAGDSEAEMGVANAWQNHDQIRAEYTTYQDSIPNPDLMRFMNQALTIYRKRNNT